MEVTEAQVFEALNIEEPAESTAAEEPAVLEDTGAEADYEPQEEPAPGKEPMSADERHANAARRRAQEQQAAIDAAVQQALTAERERSKAEINDVFRRAKLKNTVDGTDIQSLEDFNNWEKQFEDAKLKQNLRAGKLDIDDIAAVVDRHPVIAAAKEAQAREEEARTIRQNEEAQAQMQREIDEIGRYDPNIKTIADLPKAPYAKEFYGYVQKGLTFIEAFKLCNADKISTAAAEAARNSALSNARGKGHLTPPGYARGAGAVSVPADEMAMFKLMNPNASADEIQAYYNKYRK